MFYTCTFVCVGVFVTVWHVEIVFVCRVCGSPLDPTSECSLFEQPKSFQTQIQRG